MPIPELRDIELREPAKRTVREVHADDMSPYAAALAFRTRLALVPFAIFILGVVGLPDAVVRRLNQARSILPPTAVRGIDHVGGEVRDQPGRGPSVFGIFIAAWAAAAVVRSLVNALSAAIRHTREAAVSPEPASSR